MDGDPSSLTSEVIVVGAGPAGLAVGACLRRAAVPFVILERERELASSWRRHYDRLHLHTDRRHSALPGLAMPREYPRYPSRQQVVDYLEAYARTFSLAPRLGVEVQAVRRIDGGQWEVSTRQDRLRARAVVLATGWNAEPVRPDWPGMAGYRGALLHSSEYRSGERFRGQDVLVVGLGNSGGEIAIDLFEHGARPAIATRSPVNVLPRDLLGIPIQAWAIALSRLPPRVADRLAAPLLWFTVGDVSRLGLRRPAEGPMEQIRARGRIPLVDVGTVDLIRRGAIRVTPGVRAFTPTGVVLDGGEERAFDSVVLATGYRPQLARLLGEAHDVLEADGGPLRSGRETALPGLHLCGFHVAATGMFREIGLEARRIAEDLSRGRPQSVYGDAHEDPD